MFIIVDREGIIQYVNHTASGIEVEKVVGTSTYDYTLPEYHKVMKESIKHVLETGQVCRYETKGGSPGGDLAWYITQAGPIKKESQIVAVALIATDITERKQAEDKLRKSGEELRDLSAHLQTVREQERAIVAREIHDDLGQTLNVLKLDFHWLEENLPKDQEALIEKTQSMTKLVDMMVQSVRRIYSGLRPFVLDDLGLVAAIEWMAQKFQNQTEMECELFISPKDIVVDKDLATPIFRIFQDALSNVRRHANATSVKVRLEEAGKDLILIVSDNGKGITEKQVSDSKAFGLMGMRERALSFRGETNIRGIQNEGTTVKVKIPRRK
jgi:PAS domain S-box-containing protein